MIKQVCETLRSSVITVFVPNLLDHFTLVVVIVTVSAFTLSVAAVVSEYLVAVQMLSDVQQWLRCTKKAFLQSTPLAWPWPCVVLFFFFFSCSHNAGKTPNAPSATRVRSMTCSCKLYSLYLCICVVESDSDLLMLFRQRCAKRLNQFGG